MVCGNVYWITGLSGAGKSTVGRLLFERLQATKPNVVFLDGDALRSVFGSDLGHTLDDRMKSAMRNARLCKMLADQGIDVVCATISMFNACREWNRGNIPGYLEVYLKVPMETLIDRDPTGLYGRALRGEAENVWGIDLKVEEPESSDLIIDHGDQASIDETVDRIVALGVGSDVPKA